MLRVLVVCGSTRGRGGHVPPVLLETFLELLKLRANGETLQIMLHDDSPLTGEESVEEFCFVRPWDKIRRTFAQSLDGYDDAVLILESTGSGAVVGELADTLQRVRDGERPAFNVVLVADNTTNIEDARVAWGPEFPIVSYFVIDPRLADASITTLVAKVITALHRTAEEVAPAG